MLKQKAISNNFFSIYRKKNFIKNSKQSKKKLYISFVMKKKIGIAVKRNRIKRKLKGIVQKLLKIDSAINLNYTYIGTGSSGYGTINSELDNSFDFKKGSVALSRAEKKNTEDSQFFILLEDAP
ncbi:MAG: ribonuclease P protein component, partial [Nitrospinaceae bacterium]|nr:ribonuclease P protein component [Nitrospinaceae bacterium]